MCSPAERKLDFHSDNDHLINKHAEVVEKMLKTHTENSKEFHAENDPEVCSYGTASLSSIQRFFILEFPSGLFNPRPGRAFSITRPRRGCVDATPLAFRN